MGGEEGHHLFGIDEDFHAESAAHVRADHPKAFLGQAEDMLGDPVAQTRDALTRGGQGEAAGFSVIFAQGGARLHGVHHDTVVGKPLTHDLCRLGKFGGCRCLVPLHPVDAEVSRRFGPNLRALSGKGLGGVDHRRQFTVGHVDQFGRIPCLGQALGHDGGNRITDMTYTVAGQDRVRRLDRLRTVLAFHRGNARNIANLGGTQIPGGVDRKDTRRADGICNVHSYDLSMGMGTADEDQVAFPRSGNIRRITTGPGQETVVFHSAQGLTFAKTAHGFRYSEVVLILGETLCHAGKWARS